MAYLSPQPVLGKPNHRSTLNWFPRMRMRPLNHDSAPHPTVEATMMTGLIEEASIAFAHNSISEKGIT